MFGEAKEVLPAISSHVEACTKDMASAANNMNSEFVKTEETFANTVNKVASDLKQMSSQYEKQALSATKQIEKTIDKVCNDLSNHMEKMNTGIEQAGESINETVLGVAESMKQTSNEHSKQVDRITEQVETGLETVLNESLTQLTGMLVALSKKFVEDYTPLTDRLTEIVQIAENVSVTEKK